VCGDTKCKKASHRCEKVVLGGVGSVCALCMGHFLPSSLLDMVDSEDLVRVGRRTMESNPSLAALGDLTHVPERREVEEALFTSGGVLKKKRRLFSFGR